MDICKLVITWNGGSTYLFIPPLWLHHGLRFYWQAFALPYPMPGDNTNCLNENDPPYITHLHPKCTHRLTT